MMLPLRRVVGALLHELELQGLPSRVGRQRSRVIPTSLLKLLAFTLAFTVWAIVFVSTGLSESRMTQSSFLKRLRGAFEIVFGARWGGQHGQNLFVFKKEFAPPLF